MLFTACSAEGGSPAPSAPLPSVSVPGEATAPSAVELKDDKESRAAAKERAGEALGRFARPDLSPTDWWDGLAPLLSEQARSDYLGIDPATVPVTQITGKARLARVDTSMLAIVHIPTDAGLYAVTLTRSPEAPVWVVESIVPPELDPHASGG